ncbi:MAG: hypothetical protein JNL10_12955 [Verrucomicrobiales bacterium]|nr:hypothetical protein [Verrucomicrobiales bacterium]
MNSRTAVAALWAGAAFLTTGCSFSREWDRARRTPVPENEITGAWMGTWQNSNNDHADQLKAVITQVSDTEYRARFKAWWQGIFSGTFEATLQGRWEGNEFVFSGTEKVLAWEFTQQGRADSTRFVSEYSSDDFRGTFTMHRPEPVTPSSR